MIKVFSVKEMIAAEKAADAAGNTYDMMMETAGKAVSEAVIERCQVTGQVVTILVGPGNNGGDGLVAGRYLAQAGADVAFYIYKPRDPQEDHNMAQVLDMDLPVIMAEFDQRFRVLRARLNITTILIDSLLGTGVARPLSGNLAKLMKQVGAALVERSMTVPESRQPGLTSVIQITAKQETTVALESGTNGRPITVAVDCPSGLNCDSGALDPLAIPADLTITFAGPKRGHFIFPGAAACGELVVADIGIGQTLPEVATVKTELVTPMMARNLLPMRPLDGHKGSFGSVLIAAGSDRYWGAPALAGRGAYRAGAGLVALAVPEKIRATLASQLPEATYPLINDVVLLGADTAAAILADVQPYRAILLGPGLDEAADFMDRLLSPDNINQLPSMVIDADGLNLLSDMDGWTDHVPENSVLTPHPGEMARLMRMDLAKLKQQDRVELAREAAKKWNCIVLLKGAYTVVAEPDGRCAILPFANPALAAAGSGDVLSGIIVSLLGQGLDPYEAAVLGGYLHAAAAQSTGLDSGLLAREIADLVPTVRQMLLGSPTQ